MHRLVTEVGPSCARQIVLWGDMITADQAVDLGLVDEVSDDAREALRSAALLMGGVPAKEHAIRRQLLHEALTTTFEDASVPTSRPASVSCAACRRKASRRAGARIEPTAAVAT